MTATGGIALIAYLAAVVGIAVLYRYRERLKGTPPRVYLRYLGLALVFIFAVLSLLAVGPLVTNEHVHVNSAAGVFIDQDSGMVQITMVDTGILDAWGLVGPDGTKSTMGDFEAGTTITLRSNERVISYLNNPENNITVFTTSGTKTVENVSELPSEYQKAPDGLINPEADISGYSNTSVATVACLIDHTGIEMGGRKIPANVSIPCNTPVLAQNDSVKIGTSVKPTSGPSAGKTLTSPITLRSGGEYSVVGTVDGEEQVIQSFETVDEIAQE